VKIAFAMINCNRREGTARAVSEVAERLASRHEVHLFARKAEDIRLDLLQWHKIPGPAWPQAADFASYRFVSSSLLSRGRFDIVHSIGCNARAADVITIQNIQPAKKRILDKLAAGERISLPRRFTRWLYQKNTGAAEKQLYTHGEGRLPPFFLAASRGAAEDLRSHYDIGPARVRVVPNAADLDIFKGASEEKRRSWRRLNGISFTDVLLMFCGGDWTRKGLDYAIRALALIERPDVKLFVAGDDPNRARFRTLAHACGVAERVLFGGFRKDIADALAASDLFLFPSWYEAFSLATIEAAACCLPVVATRINGAEDFIQPGRTGEFIEHDPGKIAAVLKPLIRDASRRRWLGANARRSVEENYTWERVAALTESAYHEHLELARSKGVAKY